MKHTNRYEQTRTNITKQQNTKQDPNQQQQENNKINNYLRTISKLQNNIKNIQQQNLYYQTLYTWLQSFNQSKITNSTHTMKSIMSASSKLTILEKQALITKTNQQQSTISHNTTQNQHKNTCIVSCHLKYILLDNINRKQRIKQLITQRNNLYNTIQSTLIKQQPYMHDKIMKKIQKQVKRQVRLQTIRQVQRICKTKQQWISATKQQINNVIDQKLIQQKITNNLIKMKQIMGKKINNDQYITQISTNQHNIQKNIHKIHKSIAQVKCIIKQQTQKIKNQCIQKQLQSITNYKQFKHNTIQLDNSLIQQINQLMHEGYQLLAEPLTSSNSTQLQNRIQAISEQINQLTSRRY